MKDTDMNMNNKVGVTIAVRYSKWIRSALIALLLGVAALGGTGCKQSAAESGAHAHQYTCSMHPEVVKDAPGGCPKCGMKLVEKH
jgi:membrane fusion protein, copper/silver efflux system